MIEEKQYLQTVAETKADITTYPGIALKDNHFRDMLVRHLLHNNSINIYYHSYLIIQEAIKREPSLFYCYWDKFASLLKHDNSYHRNYGMALIANIVAIDKDNRFGLTMDDFYKQLKDEKISSIKYCISNSVIIIKAKPQHAATIISKIINSLRVNDNSESHQKFLVTAFLKLLTSIDNDLPDRLMVKEFLRDVLKSTKSEKLIREIKKFYAQSD